MSTIISTFILIFLAEFGDKTQLLTLMLIAHFRKPWPVFSGVLLGIIFSQGSAASLGEYIHGFVSEQWMKYIIATIFFFTGCWILWSLKQKEEETKVRVYHSAFLTCFLAFSLAELGDKTQIATAALAANSGEMWNVTIGAVLAMIVMNGLTIVFGQTIMRKVPLKWIRIFAAVICFITAGARLIL